MLRLGCFSFDWGLFLLKLVGKFNTLLHDMIHSWSSQMFLDADVSYLSYSGYVLNILYIILLE